MQAKHTKGPWETDLTWCQPGYNHHVVYVHQGPSIVAQCWLTDIYDGTFKDRQRTTEANARLIAAAPELLAALEKAADTIAELQRLGCPAGPVAIPSLINDAIAKATGQSAA